MSHPNCTCSGSINGKGEVTSHVCELCKSGARLVTIQVDSESWPRVQKALGEL